MADTKNTKSVVNTTRHVEEVPPEVS
jgi:hypothetical protein